MIRYPANEKWPDLLRAIQYLAALDPDGAREENSIGFAKPDVSFGHALARIDDWTESEAYFCWAMIRKYGRQLANIDIDVAAIPPVPKPATSRQDVAHGARLLTAQDGAFAFLFRYDEALKNRLKAKFPGSYSFLREPEPTWLVAARPATVASVLYFARDEGFAISREADNLARATDAARPKSQRKITCVPGGWLVCWGRGDPDFGILKDAVKSRFEGRRWVPEDSSWAIIANPHNAHAIGPFAREFDFGAPDVEESVARFFDAFERRAIESGAMDSDYDVPGLLRPLRPYQRAGVKALIDRNGGILADEMGLGKSASALAAIYAQRAFPAVIVCPATLKRFWAGEAKAWLPDVHPVVLDGTATPERIQAFVGEARKHRDGLIVVVNYENVPNTKRGAGWAETLKHLAPQALVVDEAHRAKDGRALQTKALIDLAVTTKPKFRVALSGTPYVKSPMDLAAPMRITGHLPKIGYKVLRDHTHWVDNGYAETPVGARNGEELNTLLRASVMVRRTKDQVAPEIPEKTIARVPVEISNRAAYDAAEADVVTWLAEQKGAEAAAGAERAEAIRRLMTLWALAGEGKVASAVAWIRDFLESGEKLVVFAHHIPLQETFLREFPDAAHILGGEKDVEEQKARFQSDPNCRLIVCATKAAGVGHTLTAASNVLIVEYPWTWVDLAQAIDRVHRIGQTKPVTAWLLTGANTIDDHMAAVVDARRADGSAVVDGGSSDARVSAVADILSRMRG